MKPIDVIVTILSLLIEIKDKQNVHNIATSFSVKTVEW